MSTETTKRLNLSKKTSSLRFKELLFLVQNSWGLWNSGPKVHEQPEGSFWIREKDARGMLAQQGSWVFSDVDGFPARDLPNYGTTSYL